MSALTVLSNRFTRCVMFSVHVSALSWAFDDLVFDILVDALEGKTVDLPDP